MTEDTLGALAWWGCPLSATVVAHGLIRRYALAVGTSAPLATLFWILLVWLDERGHLDPELQITGALFVIFALVAAPYPPTRFVERMP